MSDDLPSGTTFAPYVHDDYEGRGEEWTLQRLVRALILTSQVPWRAYHVPGVYRARATVQDVHDMNARSRGVGAYGVGGEGTRGLGVWCDKLSVNLDLLHVVERKKCSRLSHEERVCAVRIPADWWPSSRC